MKKKSLDELTSHEHNHIREHHHKKHFVHDHREAIYFVAVIGALFFLTLLNSMPYITGLVVYESAKSPFIPGLEEISQDTYLNEASSLVPMRDIQTHKQDFDTVIEKYDLRDGEKADEIAKYLTSHKEGVVSLDEFASLFGMEKEDAHTFLSFIARGLKFKEEHIDNK